MQSHVLCSMSVSSNMPKNLHGRTPMPCRARRRLQSDATVIGQARQLNLFHTRHEMEMATLGASHCSQPSAACAVQGAICLFSIMRLCNMG